MDLFCKICDRLNIESGFIYEDFLSGFRHKIDISLCINYLINNVNLDEIYKILKDYVYTPNKKFDFYFIYCDCSIEFDNNFTTNRSTNYFEIIGITRGYENLLNEIDFLKARGYKIFNINQITIKTFNDKCNMSL